MELYRQSCRNCGGDLVKNEEGQYKCRYCGSVYTEESVVKHVDALRALFDEIKLEAVANARKNLYDAVNAEYISNSHVHECCFEIKKLLPDDFQANFYETAIGDNVRKIAKAIRKINVNEHSDCVETMIKFLISSLQSEYILETGDLIERAYKGTDLTKYEKYSTELSREAEKLDDCVYLTTFPRDVFVAYSSKDMDKVFELVECLEDQGLSCFVAARNLRHGKGAVENYERALHEAMDNCQSFVFVSSMNSRHPGCDALRKEIPYIKSVDIANAPPEMRTDYGRISQIYKKHRVEYRIEESARAVAADRIVSEFFDGYERVYSPEEVAERVLNAYMSIPESIPAESQEETAPVPAPSQTPARIAVKYCVSCSGECPESVKFCPNCGANRFAGTLSESELMREIEELKKNKAQVSEPSAELSIEPDKSEIAVAEPEVKDDIEKAAEELDGMLEYLEILEEIAEDEEKDAVDNFVQPENVWRKTGMNSIDAASYGVKHVRVPDGTVGLDSFAFGTCETIESVVFPEGMTSLGDGAFNGCQGLMHIKLPKSLEFINERAFLHCKRLSKVYIPDGVENIGDSAFSGCNALKNIRLSKNLKKIGSFAFSGCGFEKIHLPASLEALEGHALPSYSLKYITVDKDSQYFKAVDNVLYSKDGKVLYKYPSCKADEHFDIPEGVETIKAGAFCMCTCLKSISFPEGLKNISPDAFSGCGSLLALDIPDSVTSIGDKAFSNCKALESVKLPTALTEFFGETFSGCKNIKSIKLPDNLETIPGNLFHGCAELEEIELPAKLKTIGVSAFEDCAKLKNIRLPRQLEKIEEQAFMNCVSIERVDIPVSIKELRDRAFKGCAGVKTVSVPNNVHTVGSNVFMNCTALETVNSKASGTVSTGFFSLGKGMFEGCVSLKNIGINEYWKIPERMFAGCMSLESVRVYSNTKSIRSGAFEGCKSLSSAVFEEPKGWKKSGAGLFNQISPKLLSDPRSAAVALTQTYVDTDIERK